jgi:hypothetical protein
MWSAQSAATSTTVSKRLGGGMDTLGRGQLMRVASEHKKKKKKPIQTKKKKKKKK